MAVVESERRRSRSYDWPPPSYYHLSTNAWDQESLLPVVYDEHKPQQSIIMSQTNNNNNNVANPNKQSQRTLDLFAFCKGILVGAILQSIQIWSYSSSLHSFFLTLPLVQICHHLDLIVCAWIWIQFIRLVMKQIASYSCFQHYHATAANNNHANHIHCNTTTATICDTNLFLATTISNLLGLVVGSGMATCWWVLGYHSLIQATCCMVTTSLQLVLIGMVSQWVDWNLHRRIVELMNAMIVTLAATYVHLSTDL